MVLFSAPTRYMLGVDSQSGPAQAIPLPNLSFQQEVSIGMAPETGRI
jgi:hypothetical protein